MNPTERVLLSMSKWWDDLDMAGGDAHEIVISDDPTAYDRYLEE